MATELFEILDADGDGQLDLSEWSSLGHVSAEFMDLFYSLDGGDKNGKISLTEWLSALQRPRIVSLSDAVFGKNYPCRSPPNAPPLNKVSCKLILDFAACRII